MMEFLQMDGHGAYVWPAYGITLAVIVLNVWAARKRLRDALGHARQAAPLDRPSKQPRVRQLQ